MNKEEELVKVGIIENIFEGEMVLSALRSANIPAMIKKYEETAYDGLFVPQKGWGSLFVPREYLEEAKDIIKEVREKIVNETDKR